MVLFLLCLTVPVAALWNCSHFIIIHLVTDPETARLASLYLRVLVLAIPGYIVLESGKRFLQVQGLFRATTYIFLVSAPCHIALLGLLMPQLGFLGAPVATVITRTLSAMLLIFYVKFFDGSACWGGFSRRALSNWSTMIRLAIPDMIMVEAEWLAFEIMTIFASKMGTDYLAAQSLLTAISTIAFQVPFPLSIAASTRVGILIGAGLVSAAKKAAILVMCLQCHGMGSLTDTSRPSLRRASLVS
jgi:MATE family multidrug resistance protein